MWQDFIKQLILDFRTSTYELEKVHGIGSATLSKLITGKTLQPNQKTIQALEKALNIIIDDSDPNNITYIKRSGEEGGFKNTVALQRFPLFSTIYAGAKGMLSHEQALGYISIPYHKTTDVFALTVSGDSMTGLVEHGDIVLVDTEATLHAGCVVAVRTTTGDQLIKKYAKQGNTVILTSNNNNYTPLLLKQEQIEVIYRVVRIIRNV